MAYTAGKLAMKTKKQGNVYTAAKEEGRKIRANLLSTQDAEDNMRMADFNTPWNEAPREKIRKNPLPRHEESLPMKKTYLRS